ncbi:MAG: nucleotide sugar dehydrogenase [Acidobacteriota bacterium]|nr:nucleotide sugar dehydrogenase [Acidobacteriota bacterium]
MMPPIREAAVFGAGVVGVPMAALLADASDGPRVVLIQRPSPASAWKVGALNEGRNPLGGIEPGLEEAIARTVAGGRLRASSDAAEAKDADAILVCVQTDKSGRGPDYGPLFGALDELAAVLAGRGGGFRPLVIIESTLAPTTMSSVIRPRLAAHGLVEGRDIDLGYSPNRVMPGRLVERIRSGDKLVAGLRPATTDRILDLYRRIVPADRLHASDPLTVEIVKTLENAQRDVRIAYAAEVARFCDAADIDFHALRAEVDSRLNPATGLLIPTVGVGGHCLPKDGILLLWRMSDAKCDLEDSLILEARRINDESPAVAAARIESAFGPLHRTSLALLGAAYRPDAADTRNSPAMALGRILRPRCEALTLHDPYVRAVDPRLAEAGLADIFTDDLEAALSRAEIIVVGTAHRDYRAALLGDAILPSARAVFDAAHLARRDEFAVRPLVYEGIGKGQSAPPARLVEAVEAGLLAVGRGLANEVAGLAAFLNDGPYGESGAPIELETIRRLAATCATGCDVAQTGPVDRLPEYPGFRPRLPEAGRRAWEKRR